MPVNKIKISFLGVVVSDTANLWGEHDWCFNANVGGVTVGDVTKTFTAKKGKAIRLPRDEWSAEVDVSGKTDLTYSVTATFVALHAHGHSSLGKVSHEFKYPFNRGKTFILESPDVQGPFLDYHYYQYYKLAVRLTVLDVQAAIPNSKFSSWKSSVNACRQHDGSTTFTTISGHQVLPRAEVCPVVPTPDWPSMMPPRPDIVENYGLWPGLDTDPNATVTLWPLPRLNATYNPSLIPILSRKDPDFSKKVAKLAVTYYEPGDLDVSKLTWKVKSGPSKIAGHHKGIEIRIMGTGSGDTDQMTEVEVHWDGEKGPLLCTFRAWVGKIKTAMYRVNLINGPTADTCVALPAQAYKDQVEMVRCLYWQAGIELIPDPNTTCWDGATPATELSGVPSWGTATPASSDPLPGVFIVPVTEPHLTAGVNLDAPSPVTRLNFRPGVLHAVYVCSTSDGRAAAVDIQGVDGKPYPPAGTPSGTPSPSWVLPSGVPPDAAAGSFQMKTFDSTNRASKKAVGDDDYVRARQGGTAPGASPDPSFTSQSMCQIYAAVLPSDWSNAADDQNAGINVGHELGHVLGLMHRGHTNQEPKGPFGSDDGIDCMAMDGVSRGHPWHENIMSYGYGGNTVQEPRAQDIDLLQTAVLRKHPACNQPPVCQ